MSPLLPLLLLLAPLVAVSKSTIEPCSGTDSCQSLAGYTLYADLKVSELAALFQADPAAILAANSIDPASSYNHILPAGLFLRIPLLCSCSDGLRKSVSTRYKTRPADTLASIATSVFAGLASPDQIREANNIPDGGGLDAGVNLVIPLPCTCFNNSDNALPAVYLSYVVQPEDTVPGIAAEYATTVNDIMNANAMGSPTASAGDIIAIPLPACASTFPAYASDYGLIVANGSYSITAGHCVQCSCGPGDLNLYCAPASLSASCSSMQCKNSNLMLGNYTSQATSAGCSVTSCTYSGLVNGSISTRLATSLQPRCPGPHQFPSLLPPPSQVSQHESPFSPSPSPHPSQPGGAMPTPKSSVPGSLVLPGLSPAYGAYGPSGSVSKAPNVNSLNHFLGAFFVSVVLKYLL